MPEKEQVVSGLKGRRGKRKEIAPKEGEESIDSGRSDRVSSRYQGSEGVRYFESYDHLWAPQAEFSLRLLSRFLAPDDSVLDFGCADGSLLAAIPNTEKVGVEVNPRARSVALGRGFRVLESLSQQDSYSIDTAISSHVLEHTLRPLDELSDLARVLKTEGTLVLILPLDDWRNHTNWSLPDPNHHLYAWTPQLLANLLHEAGLVPVTIEILSYALPGRLTKRLYESLPQPVFDLVCRATALMRRRRQLVAIARPRRPG